MHCLEISNTQLKVSLGDLGARVLDVQLLTDSSPVSLVCGYDNIEDYHTDRFFLGTTVGPIANRVRNGQYTVDSIPVLLPNNLGTHCLHSGTLGVDTKRWDTLQVSESTVEYRLQPELDNPGFPSDLTFLVRYSLVDTTLRIEHKATCSAPTYLNLTNHTYWNLNQSKDAISNHVFEIYADALAKKDDADIPNGELRVLENPFHLNLNSSDTDSDLSESVDHHFVVDERDLTLKPMLKVSSPSSGISMLVKSTKPGFQLYSGHFLDEPLLPYSGFCVEPQFVPDAINLPQFISPLTDANHPYQHTMEFEFL